MSDRRQDEPGQAASHFDAASAFSPEAMSAVMRMQASLFEAGMKSGMELVDFFKRRFEADRAMAEHMGHAGDPSEAMKLYADFWRKAMSDYAAEANKLARMNTEAAAHAGETTEQDAPASAASPRGRSAN